MDGLNPAGIVGIVGCLEFADHDEDWPPLRDALANRGVGSAFVCWDDPSVDWTSFPNEYLAWADRVAAVTTLMNPPTVLAWNMDKRYLRELDHEGISIVPTTWVGPGDGFEPPDVEFVVKPSISGGGVDTARYAPDQAVAAQSHVRRLQDEGRMVMVQDYLTAVDDEGETALIFIGGTFSHAVRKGALLELGAGVVDELWEQTVAAPVVPSSGQLLFAVTVMDYLRARFGLAPLYCRVDVVTDSAGEPTVLEVELIDPLLFLTLSHDGAGCLADAIVALV